MGPILAILSYVMRIFANLGAKVVRLTERNTGAIAKGEYVVNTPTGILGLNEFQKYTLNSTSNGISGGGTNYGFSSACYISDNIFLLAYIEGTYPKYLFATVSDSGVTTTTPVTIVSTDQQCISCCKTNNGFAITYSNGPNTNSYLYIAKCVGTTVISSTTNLIGIYNVRKTIFTNQKLVVQSDTYLRAGTINCDCTITWGVAVVASGCQDIQDVDMDKFAISYKNGNYYPCVKICTLSGTTITIGAENVVNSTSAISYQSTLCKAGANRLVVAYYNSTNTSYCLKAATISGTTPTFGTQLVLVSGSSPVPRLCQYDTDLFLVQYYQYWMLGEINEESENFISYISLTPGLPNGCPWGIASSEIPGNYIIVWSTSNMYIKGYEEVYESALPWTQFVGIANTAIAKAGIGDVVVNGFSNIFSDKKPDTSLFLDKSYRCFKIRPTTYSVSGHTELARVLPDSSVRVL